MAGGAWIENGVVQTRGSVPEPETTTQADAQTTVNLSNIKGRYIGTYDGKQISANIAASGDTAWAEVDYFYKGELPDYKGNGLFEMSGCSFQFTGTSSFTFKIEGSWLEKPVSINFVRQ